MKPRRLALVQRCLIGCPVPAWVYAKQREDREPRDTKESERG